MNDVKPRRWGWVDITPGQLKIIDGQKILTLANITAEDFEDESVHPAKYVRWLKNHLRYRKLIISGVKVRNIKISSDWSIYKDINYTPGAYQLYMLDTVWKQFFDGNAIFIPATKENE